jgi:hypothetical protein
MNRLRSSCPGLLALAVVLATFSVQSQADAYTWVDENGNRYFGDQPPPGTDAKRVDMTAGNVSFIGSEEAATGADAEAETDAAADDEASAAAPAPATAGTVEDPAHQAELCEQARRNRAAMEYGGIVRQVQDNGEAIILTPEQKQEQRDLADQVISIYCKD